VLELPFHCQREPGFAALRDILAVDGEHPTFLKKKEHALSSTHQQDMGASQLNRTVVGDMHIHATWQPAPGRDTYAAPPS
jgi:hypothetical protein